MNMSELVARVAYEVWRHIDWERVGASRRMKVYDEMTTKLRRAAKKSDVEAFVSKLCDFWDVQSLSDVELLDELKALDPGQVDEFLSAARENTQYCVWLLRGKIEEGKAKRAKKDKTGGLFDDKA